MTSRSTCRPLPGTDPVPERFQALAALLRPARNVMVLTGAGLSTGSGIPDYRDRHGEWKRPQPIQYREFVDAESGRQRYWARSMVGWREFGRARPNPAHRALARLEHQGPVHHLVTQNVDGLHHAAGSASVTDLHGRLDAVVCLGCGDRIARDRLQARLSALNPAWDGIQGRSAPDGDADLGDAGHERFEVPACEHCGGILKPDVVFFGESVPRERVQSVFEHQARADVLLVAGSSLMVFSGYRFVREAVRRAQPVVAINAGRTRADDELTLKVEGDVQVVLPMLADALCPEPG